jgi:hypothetical protein
MSNRIKITDVFEAPAYVRVESEEGPYDARRGFNVLAYTTEGRIRTTWLYTGRNCEAAICFENESFLHETLDAIRTNGSINPEFWTAVNSEDLDALPDYVLNPHRMEYN